MQEVLQEIREYRLGKKFLIKFEPHFGRLVVTDGFFHSEEIHPEQMEYIELEAKEPISIRIVSKTLAKTENTVKEIPLKQSAIHSTIPSGYEHVFSSKANKHARDGTLGIYDYYYNQKNESWYSQVRREGDNRVSQNNNKHQYRAFLGSIRNPLDKLGKFLLHIETRHPQSKFIKKDLRNIDGTMIDSQLAKSVLDVLEHDGYMIRKRSMSKPWTEEFIRSKKPVPSKINRSVGGDERVTSFPTAT